MALRSEMRLPGLPLVRLRKMVAFDPLLARLVHSQPNQWIVYGGLALQLRLGDWARTTKDIDPLVKPVEYLIAVGEAQAG